MSCILETLFYATLFFAVLLFVLCLLSVNDDEDDE